MRGVAQVWRENPLPFLRKDMDVSILQEHEVDGRMEYCMGLVGLASNERSLALMAAWEQEMKSHGDAHSSDQSAFNSALHRYNSAQERAVTVHELPKNRFPNGNEYFRGGPTQRAIYKDEDKRRKIVVVHNNFVVGLAAKVGARPQLRLHSLLPPRPVLPLYLPRLIASAFPSPFSPTR